MRRALQVGLRIALLCAVTASFAAAQKIPCPASGIEYEVSLAHRADHLVGVKAFFHSSQESRDFQLPVWNALYQVRDFSQFVGKVEARDENGEPLPVQKMDKTTWRLEGDGACQSLAYDIYADEAGPFGAQLNDEHAFFNWAEVLVYAADERNAPITLRLKDIPQGWRVRDGGVFGAYDPASGKPAVAHVNGYDRLADSPFEIGRFEETSFTEGGATYHVVVHAAPGDANINEISAMLQKVVAAAVDWMQDRPLTEYTFIYHFPKGPAGGGMEHAFSTAIDASAQTPSSAVASVSAHEFFHLWNVKRIRPQSLEPIDYTKEQYTRALWFSEGVTSTVSEHILFRAGLIDEKQFLQRLARQIGQLESRPAHKTQSVEESSLDTWYDKYPYYRRPERSISYYNKGQIVGVLLDLEMRQVSQGKHSLRDLFQYMNETYAKKGTFFPDSLGVQMAAESLTGGRFDEFFEKYVAGTDDLPYQQLFRTVGLEVARRHVQTAYAGMTLGRAIGQQPSVVRVDEDGPAAEAGVQVGDVVEEINGAVVNGTAASQLAAMGPGDTVRLKLRHNGQRREVKLKLASHQAEEYSLQDIVDITPAMRARRAAWLRGDSEVEAAK